MSEIDKLNNGEWFNFGAPEIVARKLNAAKLSQQFNAIPETEPNSHIDSTLILDTTSINKEHEKKLTR